MRPRSQSRLRKSNYFVEHINMYATYNLILFLSEPSQKRDRDSEHVCEIKILILHSDHVRS